jgi:hypothetical protein
MGKGKLTQKKSNRKEPFHNIKDIYSTNDSGGVSVDAPKTSQAVKHPLITDDKQHKKTTKKKQKRNKKRKKDSPTSTDANTVEYVNFRRIQRCAKLCPVFKVRLRL